MREVMLCVKTIKSDSTVKVGTGYSKDEWEILEERDKRELVQEIVWEIIDVWEELE